MLQRWIYELVDIETENEDGVTDETTEIEDRDIDKETSAFDAVAFVYLLLRSTAKEEITLSEPNATNENLLIQIYSVLTIACERKELLGRPTRLLLAHALILLNQLKSARIIHAVDESHFNISSLLKEKVNGTCVSLVHPF